MTDLPPPHTVPAGPTVKPAGPTAKHSGTRPAKPDPRPLRVVYGAGALAVASVMVVGLVQPDVKAGTDQSAGSDEQAAAHVAHVIEYVQLLPGQTAPPGATVIISDQAQPPIVVADDPGSLTTSASNNNAQRPANNPARPKVKTHQSGHS